MFVVVVIVIFIIVMMVVMNFVARSQVVFGTDPQTQKHRGFDRAILGGDDANTFPCFRDEFVGQVRNVRLLQQVGL